MSKTRYFFVLLVFCIVLLGVFLFQSFFSLNFVSGISMEPTITKNSLVVLKKSDSLTRGQIVVFERPLSWGQTSKKALKGKNSGGYLLIKRVAAVEGDKVFFGTDQVYVNGKVAAKMPENCKNAGLGFVVPKGDFVAFGDNVNHSNDSRWFTCVTGANPFVPVNSIKANGEIVGKLF